MYIYAHVSRTDALMKSDYDISTCSYDKISCWRVIKLFKSEYPDENTTSLARDENFATIGPRFALTLTFRSL